MVQKNLGMTERLPAKSSKKSDTRKILDNFYATATLNIGFKEATGGDPASAISDDAQAKRSVVGIKNSHMLMPHTCL
jgi:hypothetical protein